MPKTKREIAGLAPGQRAGMDRHGLDGVGSRDGSISSGSSCSRTRSGTCRSSTSTTDVARAEGASGAINALDPNLKPFFDRGGKLIQYHGWSDPQITPLATAPVLDRVVAAQRRRRQGARVLPAVHGARHGALRRRRRARTTSTWWRRSSSGWSTGKAPDAILASHCDRRPGRSHAAALPVSAGGGLQRQRQHRRGRKLRLQATLRRKRSSLSLSRLVVGAPGGRTSTSPA